jgi:hypothetical protein
MVCFSYCWLLCATKTLYIQLLYNWRPRYGASECIAEVSIFSHSPDVIFTKKRKKRRRFFLGCSRGRFHKTLLVVVV